MVGRVSRRYRSKKTASLRKRSLRKGRRSRRLRKGRMSRRLRKGRMSRRLRKYRGGADAAEERKERLKRERLNKYVQTSRDGHMTSMLGSSPDRAGVVSVAEALRGAEAAQARPPPAGSGDSGFGSGASSRTGSDDSGGSSVNSMYDADGAPLTQGKGKGKVNRMMRRMPLGYGTREQRDAAIHELERAKLESSNRYNRGRQYAL